MKLTLEKWDISKDGQLNRFNLEMKIRNKYQFKPINLKIKAGLTLGDHTHKEDKTGNLL